MAVPKYEKLFNPTLQALHALGGSGRNDEIVDEVARSLRLGDSDLAETTSNGTQSRFEYRLAWARSYLKAFGLLENSERGVWSLSPRGRDTTSVDPAEVKRFVRTRYRESLAREDHAEAEAEEQLPPEQEASSDWREELLGILLSINPDQFERLCQRILRESGFTHVEVAGRSGDGGIDGVGTVRRSPELPGPFPMQETPRQRRSLDGS